MKLSIHQDECFTEAEIIINCPFMDERLQKLADYIRQFSFSIECEVEGKIYHIPVEKVLYLDSVDGRTFLYDIEQSYLCRQSLTSLEERLQNMAFVRISKSCLMNISYLKCVQPYFNHRLKAELTNGEQLIITRNYVEALKNKITNQ